MSDMEPANMDQPGHSDEGSSAASDVLDGLHDDDFGAEGDLDAIVAGEPTRKKSKGVMILVLVVGLAVGSLFSMHALTKVTASAGRNTEIERTIENFLTGRSGSTAANPNGGSADDLVQGQQEIVSILKDNFTGQQVNELGRDPFSVEISGMSDADLAGGDGDYMRAKRRGEIEQAASKLELKSVIMGSNPLANINGRIVRLNQTIPVQGPRSVGTIQFRVASISATSVMVVVDDPNLELQVEYVIKLKR